jgi:hypothetical protein
MSELKNSQAGQPGANGGKRQDWTLASASLASASANTVTRKLRFAVEKASAAFRGMSLLLIAWVSASGNAHGQHPEYTAYVHAETGVWSFCRRGGEFIPVNTPAAQPCKELLMTGRAQMISQGKVYRSAGKPTTPRVIVERRVSIDPTTGKYDPKAVLDVMPDFSAANAFRQFKSEVVADRRNPCGEFKVTGSQPLRPITDFWERFIRFTSPEVPDRAIPNMCDAASKTERASKILDVTVKPIYLRNIGSPISVAPQVLFSTHQSLDNPGKLPTEKEYINRRVRFLMLDANLQIVRTASPRLFATTDGSEHCEPMEYSNEPAKNRRKRTKPEVPCYIDHSSWMLDEHGGDAFMEISLHKLAGVPLCMSKLCNKKYAVGENYESKIVKLGDKVGAEKQVAYFRFETMPTKKQ